MADRRTTTLLATVVVAALAASCSTTGDGAGPTTSTSQPQEAVTTTVEATTTTAGPDGDIPPEENSALASGEVTYLNVTDPVFQGFTVDVPEGWNNLVYSTVEGQVVHQVVTSVSPDGGTIVFADDPELPSYWNPDTANPITVQFADWLESMELAHYDPASSYGPSYVAGKFGSLPGFSQTSVEQDPELEQKLWDAANNAGVALSDVDVVWVRFRFEGPSGDPMSGLVVVTTSNAGTGDFWTVQVMGLATNGDVDDYVPIMNTVNSTRATTPTFQDTLNRKHQEAMDLIRQRTEEMTQGHNQRMQWIQDSANAHQARMEAIWSANDASMAAYYERMESGDFQHQQFLNYINEETTVQNSGGTQFQVSNSYNSYWQNTATGQWVGGPTGFGPNDLSEMGYNPADFEELVIVSG